MSFSPTNVKVALKSTFAMPLGTILVLGGILLLSGCIADSAEDSDLPWASNKNWEGIAPISPQVMDRYD